MEKRIGVIAVLVTDTASVKDINDALHAYGHLVLGRQGLPLRDKGVNVISSSSKATPTSSEPFWQAGEISRSQGQVRLNALPGGNTMEGLRRRRRSHALTSAPIKAS